MDESSPAADAGHPVTRSAGHAADAVTPTGAAKVVAPVAAIAATWGVRKALDSAYRGATGHEPPRANDPDRSLRQVLMWAAISAAALAVVNVVLDRALARWK